MKKNLEDWVGSFFSFENGDGTRYNLHINAAQYGGWYVNCNESSLWRYHYDGDLKFLCGDDNEWTRRAILQLFESRGV